MPAAMDKTYNPDTIESHWRERWEAAELAAVPTEGEPYSIMLPPPNVTGTLHMGHGFQQTLMDAMIRYQRMRGKRALWQPGTDHAGIATQMVVERQLVQDNITRHDLGREKFLERVWEWREQSGATIINQMRRLGTCMDWRREQFSMSPQLTRATYAAFIELHDKGLIYRGKRLVNWDPELLSAISDLEVENKLEKGNLWHIRYPLSDGSGHLVVATTRPETMLGDTGVAVHPEDERYQDLIGKTISLPLTDREIPIVADEHVDREFGTGCVKVTPAHDFNDYEIGQRHQLPMLNIFTLDAHLTEDVPESYRGLERYEARKKIVADLEQLTLIEKIEAHEHQVPFCERSGAIIEPMLTDQWFLKARDLAPAAIDVVKDKRLQFVPENWGKIYLQWLENIQDWCISRQLWWGHRIPVWYDDDGNTYVGFDEADARERNKLDTSVQLKQDEDVLDTWFTASLYPFSTLGWPEQNEELELFYPSAVLFTGFDIIFFWVARMVMMGMQLKKDIPFRKVYITGLVRDHLGQKMSKSKGNVIDPIDLIDGIELEPLIEKRITGLMQPEKAKDIADITRQEYPNGIPAFGTDALRFTFCALATMGRDVRFDLGRIEGYRNFCNKIWNAVRFVLMHTEHKDCSAENSTYSLADRWIVSQLQKTIEQAHVHFENYRFDLLASVLYEFTWNDYCDWYLELAKCTLNNDDAGEEMLRGTRYTLLHVLESLLRLLHPLMPFITEEVWHKIAAPLQLTSPSILLQAYPESDNKLADEEASECVAWLKQITTSIRTIRSEMNVAPSKKIDVIFNKGDDNDRKNQSACIAEIKTLANVKSLAWHDEKEVLPASATAVVGSSLEIHIPLAGLIDRDAECSRLNKEIVKLEKDLTKSQQKLNNPNYVNKAPSDVVAKERERLDHSQATLDKLREQLARISELS